MKKFITTLDKLVEKKYWIFFAAVLIVATFNLFYRLGALPVQNLDEARQGISAYEMVQSGDWIKSTYQFQTDYYNTKPPLLFWLISLSYKVFGFGAFAMRFPSALLALVSIVLTMLLAKKYYNRAASLISGLVLSATYAFVHFHAARKGDFDSLLVCLIVTAMFFLIGSDRKKYFYYLSGLVTGLAFLAKSFAVIQIFGIVILYLFFSGRYKKLKITDHLLYLLAFIVPVGIWALFRFQADGLAFFQAMVGNDMVSRTGQALGTIPNNPLWYFGIVALHFFPWSLLLVLALFYKNSAGVVRTKDGQTRLEFGLNGFFRHSLFSVWAVVPFVLFSLVSTRLDWYIMPIYPPLSILVGWFAADAIFRKDGAQKYFLGGGRMLAAFVALLLVYEVASVIVINDQDRNALPQKLLLNMKLKGGNTSSIYFVNRGENYGEMFLAEVLHGYRARISGSANEFVTGSLPGDVLFLPEDAENVRFVETNRLKVLEKSCGYLIVGK